MALNTSMGQIGAEILGETFDLNNLSQSIDAKVLSLPIDSNLFLTKEEVLEKCKFLNKSRKNIA